MCGDPWDGPRAHEAGGRYATGLVTQHYTVGETVDVQVELTANHKGYFEFRICPTNDKDRRATQACLDRHLLRLVDGSTRLPISSDMRMVTARLQLPRGLTCSQCVLQWKYNTGRYSTIVMFGTSEVLWYLLHGSRGLRVRDRCHGIYCSGPVPIIFQKRKFRYFSGFRFQGSRCWYRERYRTSLQHN